MPSRTLGSRAWKTRASSFPKTSPNGWQSSSLHSCVKLTKQLFKKQLSNAKEGALKFGLIYELQQQKPWVENQEHKTYHDALDQIELADKVGFDYVWEVEHHFLVEYSHSSAPEVFLAAASQRTKNIRIGQGVALLPNPFNHPIRVAERAAALDIVSDGRLELGTGRSITEQELGGFGIDPADSRPMWEEAIQMIPKMWQTEEFAWEGDYFVVPPRNVLPKPVQKPHPPLWMACTQPDSFRIAGG